MKRIVGGIIAVGIIALGVLFLLKCKDTPNGTYTIKDFEKVGAVYAEGDREAEQELGKTVETALVPLVFDENGYLFSRDTFSDRYEQYVDGKLDQNIYFTDLTTYRTVTNDPYATGDYIFSMGGVEGPSFFLYDPYREGKPPTFEERQINIQKR